MSKTLGRKPTTSDRTSSQREEQPLPLRSLLKKPVVISITNHGTLSFLEAAASELFPLIWSTVIDLGRLSLSPAGIGVWISTYGCVSAVSQFAFFPSVIAYFGPGRVVFASAAAFGLIHALFRLENMLARSPEIVAVVWLLIVLQLISMSVSDVGYRELSLAVALITDRR